MTLRKRLRELFLYFIALVLKIRGELQVEFLHMGMTFGKKLKELFVYFTFGHHLDFVTIKLIH